MYYITFIDPPSGVYQSQVIDVVKKLNTLGNENVRLVSFLPWQDFKSNRKKIHNKDPKALVLPLFFGVSRWRWMKYLFPFFLKRKRTVIGRGPLPTSLSLGYFDRVIYDGRAAVKAEILEYNITQNEKLNESFITAEKQSVLQSDFRLAVSNQLITYWKSNYGYNEKNHVIIPCTLSSETTQPQFQNNSSDRIKIVYSGGTSGWQSFGLIVELLEKSLENQSNIELVFLTKETPEITSLSSKFPDRVQRKWLKHEEVFDELKSCDYGILIRDDKWTNRVASPVKFAEYLHAGLKVLISSQIGDFSSFTFENNVGIIVKDEIPILEKIDSQEKKRIHAVCTKNFLKSTPKIEEKYQQILNFSTSK